MCTNPATFQIFTQIFFKARNLSSWVCFIRSSKLRLFPTLPSFSRKDRLVVRMFRMVARDRLRDVLKKTFQKVRVLIYPTIVRKALVHRRTRKIKILNLCFEREDQNVCFVTASVITAGCLAARISRNRSEALLNFVQRFTHETYSATNKC